jgi:hypothetical protein
MIGSDRGVPLWFFRSRSRVTYIHQSRVLSAMSGWFGRLSAMTFTPLFPLRPLRSEVKRGTLIAVRSRHGCFVKVLNSAVA